VLAWPCAGENGGKKRGAQDAATPILKGPAAGRERRGVWSGVPHGEEVGEKHGGASIAVG
jgi:hypothetical protein